jgi:Leucine-rich repeat (LRR) protein
VLAKIRDDYPRTKVVWRIVQPNKTNRSWLTDTDTLRAVYHVNDTNSHLFKYLTEVKYMDLGHNTSMVDLSFCAYMPNLEIAILSGSPIKDLTPLGNCKKLEFLEIAWCGNVKDVSPLAGCDSLKHLNVSHTVVKDFTALKHLKLEMLCYVNSGNRAGLTADYWKEVQAMFPECWITYNPLRDNNATPYGIGWRYKESGGYTPIYRKVRDVFGYDEIDKVLQGQK